jgi:hypothetical protein
MIYSGYVDTMMNDFFLLYSQNCGVHDHSSTPTEDQTNIANDDKMEVDSKLEPPEEYDIFADLAFLESINSQHFDIPLSIGDQPSTTEFSDYDTNWARMAELRELLLETFPDGMPEEIDYKSILAEQHIPSDPQDPSFWDYLKGSDQTPDEQ